MQTNIDLTNANQLEKYLVDQSTKYYQGKPTELTDNEFDQLILTLKSLNPNAYILSQTGFGFQPTASALEKREHLYAPMIGISRKIRPEDYKPESDLTFVSTKLDGASVGIYYKNGKFDFALTRGNGKIGLDISDKISKIVPSNVSDNFTGRIRGEFVLPRGTFEKYYCTDGAKSPRNTSAGFLNKKDWEVSSLQHFRLIVYTVTDSNGINKPLKDGIEWLTNNKFDTAKIVGLNSSDIQNAKVLEKTLEYYRQMAYGQGHEIDCDGFVGYDSNGIFALKWNVEFALARVVDVSYQQSRHGKLTPVVNIEPTELQDCTISKCTGFNAKYILDNRIGEGSLIRITRSGDVIPHIVDVIDDGKLQLPTECPNCGSKLEWDGVDLVCKNKSCSLTSFEKIMNFINTVSPIDGIGESIIRKFVEYLDVIGIYEFVIAVKNTDSDTIQSFINVTDGTGQSAFDKLSKMTEIIKGNISANKFLQGLGLKGLGEKYTDKIFDAMSFAEFTDKILNNHIGSFDMINVTGRKSLYENRMDILQLINIMNVVEVNKLNVSTTTSSTMDKIPVCITGKLSMGRKEFLSKITAIAYEVPIAKAKILITDNPNGTSSKNKYANDHGIEKMSEVEFCSKYC